MITNIMIDEETVGTKPNSSIIALGACKFDLDLGISETFYEVIDIADSLKNGFDVDGDTIKWWLTQSESARQAVAKQGKPVKEVLKSFKQWCGTDNKQVWGNGSDFDNVLLTNHYHKFNVVPPWKYWENRCFRTMRGSFKEVELDNVGTHHNALDDAIWQANYLIKLVEENNLENVL